MYNLSIAIRNELRNGQAKSLTLNLLKFNPERRPGTCTWYSLNDMVGPLVGPLVGTW